MAKKVTADIGFEKHMLEMLAKFRNEGIVE